jgi:hypothetical protein
MKTPSGRVTATIAAMNTKICNQPMAVMGVSLEPFWTNERVDEVRAEHHGHERADSIVEGHGLASFSEIVCFAIA